MNLKDFEEKIDSLEKDYVAYHLRSSRRMMIAGFVIGGTLMLCGIAKLILVLRLVQ